MDTECQDAPLLSPLPDSVDSVKVYPFIVHLKRDVIVSRHSSKTIGIALLTETFFSCSRPIPSLAWRCVIVIEEPRFVFLSLDARRYPYMATSADTALSWEFVSALLPFEA